jgi:hypothetical protein
MKREKILALSVKSGLLSEIEVQSSSKHVNDTIREIQDQVVCFAEMLIENINDVSDLKRVSVDEFKQIVFGKENMTGRPVIFSVWPVGNLDIDSSDQYEKY